MRLYCYQLLIEDVNRTQFVTRVVAPDIEEALRTCDKHPGTPFGEVIRVENQGEVFLDPRMFTEA